jgi:prepilin peptidase CpaA
VFPRHFLLPVICILYNRRVDMTNPPAILGILLAILVVIAAVYDLRYRRIPNWLVLTGLIVGLALNSFLFQWQGLKSAALGIGIAFLIYFPLYLLRAMGAGDVKLMGAIGAMVGPANWFGIFVLTGILGGVWAVLLLLSKGRVRRTLWNVACIVNEVAHFRAPYLLNDELDVKSPRAVTLPHGAVIAVGCLTFLGVAAVWAPR